MHMNLTVNASISNSNEMLSKPKGLRCYPHDWFFKPTIIFQGVNRIENKIHIGKSFIICGVTKLNKTVVTTNASFGAFDVVRTQSKEKLEK
jgi:hypothetical protein